MEEIEYILSKLDIVDRNMMVGLARKYGMVYPDEFMTAQTLAEKAAVLNELLKKDTTGIEKKEGR